jgi:hypothetical protein
MTIASMDEIVVDPRSWREKALAFKQVAAYNIGVGLGAAKRGMNAMWKHMRKYVITLLLVCLYIAVFFTAFFVSFVFFAWLWSISPILYWVVLIALIYVYFLYMMRTAGF